MGTLQKTQLLEEIQTQYKNNIYVIRKLVEARKKAQQLGWHNNIDKNYEAKNKRDKRIKKKK
ncbi:MAG: hypothetical protein QXP07_03190 [Candidatus Parvarchaeum sp.]|nr:hypothetical protein [Candidatus Parvarchaeum tengchongense]